MNSFCTECQAAWAQPWYDVCPACGHRFKAKPSAMPALIALFVGPLVALIGIFVTERFGSGFGNSVGEQLMVAGSILVLVGVVVAAVLLARRTDYGTWGKVLTGVLLFPILLLVVGALTIGGCAWIATRL